MTPREQVIDHLMTIKYGSINNFFSINARDPKGSMLQVSKYFNDFVKHGYIRPLAYDLTPRNRRKEIFHTPTLKGAKYVGREAEYKFKSLSTLFSSAALSRFEKLKVNIIDNIEMIFI